MKNFKFSIIISVYQVAEYIDEAMFSLFNQDIGFEDNVHLILVDDGSTDGSGRICDEYAARYPENIEVIHKENGGLASARNVGLAYVKGEYVNFFDPDDVLESDVLSLVYEFFQAHGDEVELASIPYYMFENKTGEYPLNRKFEKGSRVIDLMEEYESVQLSMATSFVKKDTAQQLRFNDNTHVSEDMEVLMEYFIHQPRYGVVAGARYMYRRRASGGSILNTVQDSKHFYLYQLEMFAKAFARAEEVMGEVPRFLQYMVMYDIQWIYTKPKDEVEQVLDAADIARLYSLLDGLLARIDDEVILQQRNIYDESKMRLLERKYREKTVLRHNNGDIEIWFHEHNLRRLSRCMVKLEFMSLRDDVFILEGHITLIGAAIDLPMEILLKINGHKMIPCQLVEGREDLEVYNLCDKVARRVAFRGEIRNVSHWPALDIAIVTRVAGQELERKSNFSFGNYFPLLCKFKNEYVMLEDWMCFFAAGMHLRLQRVTRYEEEAREEALLKEFLAIGTEEAREAVALRRAYYALKDKVGSLWLVADRLNKADDNGEAFFDFLQKAEVPEKCYFVLRQDSPDWERLASSGKAVAFQSHQHHLLHLLAECLVYSSPAMVLYNPFNGDKRFYQDILYKKRRIFLQHGITKNDVSKQLNRYNSNFDTFITAANGEYKSIVEGNYFYGKDVVKLTGLARYDLLEDRREKKITIMPTWRDYLGNNSTFAVDGIRRYDASFKESDFFKFYNALLNHPKLLAACDKHGYTLQFMPHPGIVAAVEYFDHDPRVCFLSGHTRYRDVYAESALVLTDYSSAVFDFAYLHKPVLYAQFDQEKFFSAHYKRGYYDYERDGFGEVAKDLESTVDMLCDYIENDCQLKSLYRERIDRFFAFKDRGNCQRIYEAIREGHKENEACTDNLGGELGLLSETYISVLCESVKYEGMDRRKPLPKEGMRYIFPIHKLPRGSKVALYGAGEVGRQFYRLNERYHFVDVTAIVDINPEGVMAKDIPVESIEQLSQVDFDYVLVTLRFANVAAEARKTLVGMGISQEKIVWDGPLYCVEDFYKNYRA